MEYGKGIRIGFMILGEPHLAPVLGGPFMGCATVVVQALGVPIVGCIVN